RHRGAGNGYPRRRAERRRQVTTRTRVQDAPAAHGHPRAERKNVGKPMLSWLDGWRALVPLVLAAAAVMGSPGPSTISVTAVGAAFGFRRSLRYAAGLVAGTTAVLLAIALGMATLLVAVPGVAPLLAAAAGLYILYLAYRIATAPPLDRQGGEVAVPSFIGGFLLALANPKAWLAITAVFTGTSVVSGAGWLDAAVKTAV